MRCNTKRRLAVARFWYEGNAFCPLPCKAEDFIRREWVEGSKAIDLARGTATELGAVAAFVDTEKDWAVVTLRCASALPGGPIDDALHLRFTTEVVEALKKQGPFDAVYLSLHGAAITDRREIPDLDFVRAVRQAVLGVPVGASFDLHANLSPDLGPLLDYASGYRTYPHVDMYETADRVLRGLVDIVENGKKTRVSVTKPGLLLSSVNMRTDAGPMRELQDIAEAQVRPGVIEASVFGGFPYADTSVTGASVVTVTDVATDPVGAATRGVEETLHAALREHAPAFAIALPTAEQGIAQALAIVNEQEGLVAVTDPGDNPWSGGACDTPGLFDALLRARPSVPTLFASFADPQAVSNAYQAGVGGQCSLELGGRLSQDFGEPVPVDVRVERLTDGVFRNTGPLETGVVTRCGRTALLSLVEQPNIRVIITDKVAPANDPAFFALHSIDLAKTRLLCVKAKNHFRAAFRSRCVAIVDIDAPGPACMDLRLLPFRRLPKGLLDA